MMQHCNLHRNVDVELSTEEVVIMIKKAISIKVQQMHYEVA